MSYSVLVIDKKIQNLTRLSQLIMRQVDVSFEAQCSHSYEEAFSQSFLKDWDLILVSDGVDPTLGHDTVKRISNLVDHNKTSILIYNGRVRLHHLRDQVLANLILRRIRNRKENVKLGELRMTSQTLLNRPMMQSIESKYEH